jgi:hypothetical protein
MRAHEITASEANCLVLASSQSGTSCLDSESFGILCWRPDVIGPKVNRFGFMNRSFNQRVHI